MNRWLWLWRSLLLAAAYLGAGWLCLKLHSPSPLVSVFWPALGGALAALVRWGPGCVPGLLLGALAVQLSAGAPVGLAVAIAVGNVAGPWAAARWLQHAGFNPQLARRRDLWLLLGAGGLGATLMTALNGASWLAAGGLIAAAAWPSTVLLWWAGDTLGLLVAGVPLLTLSRRSLDAALAPQRRHATLALLAATVVLLGAAGTSTAWLGLGSLAPLLAVPVLLCALAMRAGLATASAAVLAVTLVSVLATTSGLGPYALVDQLQPGQGQLLLWAVAGAMAALMLVAHALTGELARLDERWQLALASSDLGVADWNLRTGESDTSARWQVLMDDPHGQGGRSLAHWLEQVHADDRPALDAALAPQAGTGGPGLQRELRLRRGTGWHWFDLHLHVAERSDSGAPLRVVASLADVGARHDAAASQQLSASVFMHLHEGLAVTDARLQVLDANPSYCRIVGIPREELIGTVPALLRPGLGIGGQTGRDDGLHRPQQAGLFAALHSHGHWMGEVLERRRNGEPCALHITVSTVHGPDGALRHHVLVVSDVTEQRLQREQLARQAHVDELTRLPNRARLNQLLAEAMAATDRDGSLLAVCYLDLDHFKAINARHGHAAGDLFLAELANRLRTALRVRGTVWSDAAARLGGDEFVLLLRAGTVDEARSAVQRVLRVVAQPVAVRPGTAPETVTASVGATVYPLDASDADTLLRHADHAMYGVKQSGRNGFLFFDPEHSRRTEERVSAIGRVQDALDRHELLLYFQPKVDLRRGVVLGFEALLRWNHPELGIVAPAQFLPLIEHTGLSARVGDHVLARALDQLEAWQDAGLDLSVSVNITARHLQEPDFAQRLRELLARHQRALGPRLELEMLETAALADIGVSSAVLARCAELGVRWALDDFGTGYSTLTYLKRLPVQVLKIDRSFVHNMLDDAQDRAIVEGVINLSRTFDCQVVAEGVESAAQARVLLDLGCEVGQGMGIAAPMPAGEVLAWVRNWKGLFALTTASTTASTTVSTSTGDADAAGLVDNDLPPPRGQAGD
jgi:diguanylate cyclase (GGDEF)-like protein/PAS domain S-box-containing protein